MTRARPSRLIRIAQGVAAGFVVLLLGLLTWKVFQPNPGADLVAAIRRGALPVAPNFDLPVISDRSALWPPAARQSLNDGRVNLVELRGVPVVLNFWASWCLPCRDEAPVFANAARANRGRVAFLGLDIQDLTQDARGFLRRLDVPYPSIRDGSDKSFRAYGLTGVPETYYIDAKGRIVAHTVGPATRKEMERQLRLLGDGSK